MSTEKGKYTCKYCGAESNNFGIHMKHMKECKKTGIKLKKEPKKEKAPEIKLSPKFDVPPEPEVTTPEPLPIEETTGQISLPPPTEGASATLDVSDLPKEEPKQFENPFTFYTLRKDLSEEATMRANTIFANVDKWIRNFKTNCTTLDIGPHNGVHNLPEIEGAAIIVDNQRSLDKQINELRKFKGAILATDRVLDRLLREGIIPTHVANVDASYLCHSFFDTPRVRAHSKNIYGVFAVTTDTLTVRFWHGKRYFFIPYSEDTLGEMMAIKSKVPMMLVGGNVATFLWVLAVTLGANPIGLVGMDMAYDNIQATEYPGVTHVKLKGPIDDKDYFQDPVYAYYEMTTKNFAKRAKQSINIDTFNVTEGGVLYGEYVKHMPLKDFVKKYQ